MSKALYDDFDDEFAKSSIPQKFTVEDFEPDMSVLPTGMHTADQGTLVSEVFIVSKISKERSRYDVLGALVEEVGELATEVSIAEGYSSKSKGNDGLIGEAVDVIICALDLIYVDWKNADPDVLENYIMTIVKNKAKKWKTEQQ